MKPKRLCQLGAQLLECRSKILQNVRAEVDRLRNLLTSRSNPIVEAFGRANLRDVITPTSNQIATICYTSVRVMTYHLIPSTECIVQGTTGQPKGTRLAPV